MSKRAMNSNGDDAEWHTATSEKTKRTRRSRRLNHLPPDETTSAAVVPGRGAPRDFAAVPISVSEPRWLSQLPLASSMRQEEEDLSFERFVLILAGLPGSGKTTFARKLVELQPYKYVRVNQDDLGNRDRCLDAAALALEAGQCPIIDRCNQDPTQRAHWIELARAYHCPADGLLFVAPPQVCIQRCQQRSSHPTVKAQDAGMIVGRMARTFVLPTPDEGYRTLRQVTDDYAARNALLSYLGASS